MGGLFFAQPSEGLEKMDFHFRGNDGWAYFLCFLFHNKFLSIYLIIQIYYCKIHSGG